MFKTLIGVYFEPIRVSKGNHRVIFVDDIMFKAPVEIGSILLLHAQVVYSKGKRFQIRVRIEKRSPGTMLESGIATNVLHLTFEADEPVPKVTPKAYGEMMLYLSGRRHYEVQAKNFRDLQE